MEGTVQISIKEFDKLRDASQRYDLLKSSLHRCTEVEDKETEKDSDEWIQVVQVDAMKLARIAVQYSDIEEFREEDIIELINVD